MDFDSLRPSRRYFLLFRLPFGFLFLCLFVFLSARPHITAHQSKDYHNLTINRVSRHLKKLTWTDLVFSYIFFFSSLFAVCYLYENLRILLVGHPRYISLTDDYVKGNPPKVDPQTALHYDTPMTTYERIKCAFFILSGVAFIRIACFLLFTSIAVLFLAAVSDRNHRPVLFLICSQMGLLFGNLAATSLGVYRINSFGEVAKPSECKILISNHSCALEVIILWVWAHFPSFVSSKGNSKVPLFSRVCKMSQAIMVDRTAANSRHDTLQAIVDRAKDPNGAQLLIFPEGTTGNQQTLFQFKKGAFEAGVPVQMLCIYFPYTHFNPAWTGVAVGGNNAGTILLRLCCQFANYIEMRALPVYYPTEEEKKDAILYAGHCQKMMATVLHENISDATYRTYVEANKAYAEKQKQKEKQN